MTASCKTQRPTWKSCFYLCHKGHKYISQSVILATLIMSVIQTSGLRHMDSITRNHTTGLQDSNIRVWTPRLRYQNSDIGHQDSDIRTLGLGHQDTRNWTTGLRYQDSDTKILTPGLRHQDTRTRTSGVTHQASELVFFIQWIFVYHPSLSIYHCYCFCLVLSQHFSKTHTLT